MSTNSKSDKDPDGISASRDTMTAASLSKLQQRSAITVLLLLYILNFLDRQVINILAEPIKNELALADWQLGLLTGFAFALFYALAGIPIARLAERSNRRNIIGVATAIWSVFTMLCGVASSYIHLLLFRFGVGVGEAGLVPPAHSLIADITPREKRASAMAIFHLGLPIGSLAGLAFGGIVADLAGWRMAFILAGAPGIILALLVFVLLPEPRIKQQLSSHANNPKQSFGEALKYLLAKRSFVFSTMAAVAVSLAVYAHQAFSPAFFFRVHGAELAELSSSFGLEPKSFLGIFFGLILGVGGGVGLWLSGKLADFASRSGVGNYCLVPAIGLLLFFPIQVAAFLSPSLIGCLILFFPAILLGSCWLSPLHATVQSVAPTHMRSTASAIVLLSINLIGLGFGPLLTGIVSDQLVALLGMSSAVALTWSLVFVTFFALAAALCFLCARKHVEVDLEG